MKNGRRNVEELALASRSLVAYRRPKGGRGLWSLEAGFKSRRRPSEIRHIKGLKVLNLSFQKLYFSLRIFPSESIEGDEAPLRLFMRTFSKGTVILSIIGL